MKKHRPIETSTRGEAQPAAGQGRARGAGGRGNQAAMDKLRAAKLAFDDPVVPVPFRGLMERGFGRSFATVRCHAGEASEQATAALGCEAFMEGEQIAFGSAKPTPLVVAHELAHVVQQSGGKPTPGALGIEQDADQAARTVIAGGVAAVGNRSGTALRQFTAAEHVEIGDRAADKAVANVGISASKVNLNTKRKDGETLSYGQACKQGADKYDTIREFNIGLTRNDKDDFAEDNDLSKKEVIADNGNIRSENKAEVRSILREARNEGYDKDNFAHTWKVNKQEWGTFHTKAIRKAASGKLQVALRNEAFAAHFLQDGHAAGHLIPRAVEFAAGGRRQREPETGLSWHDYFNEHGAPTTKGILYGDEFLHKAPTNVMSATRASLEEVLTAYQTGQVTTSSVGNRFPEPVMNAEDLSQLKKPKKRMDGKRLTVTDAGYDARAERLLPKVDEMIAMHEGYFDTLTADVAAGEDQILTPAGNPVSLSWLLDQTAEMLDR